MSNEEKNITPENTGAEENKATSTEAGGQKKLSGGMLGLIIGGAVLVIAAIVLAIILLTGNNNGGQGSGDGSGDGATDTKVTYCANVVDQDGNPVVGAIVYIYQDSLQIPYVTGADGKTDGYRTDKNLEASLFSLPVGYSYDKMGQKQSFGKDGNLTFTVTKLEEVDTGVSYLIRVVDQNNNPVVGAKVQMCESENEGVCLNPIITDENGEATYKVEEKGYKAAITSLPEGYEKISDDYTHFANGVAVIVVNKTAD